MWFIETFLKIYYFNIIMISAIIVGVLVISYNKTKAVVINNGEKSTQMGEKKFPPTVKYVIIYGLVFFTLREYGYDWAELISGWFESTKGAING